MVVVVELVVMGGNVRGGSVEVVVVIGIGLGVTGLLGGEVH